MELTFTRQTWNMFAPNPPTSNVTLRTIIVDGRGERHDLRSEDEHPENFPRPYIWHDRWRKVKLAVASHRRWLGPWHARYQCRRWALEHDGAPPKTVILKKIESTFPPPTAADPAAYFWTRARARATLTVTCVERGYGTLDNELRARHGLELVPSEALVRPVARGERARRWSERRAGLDPLLPLWPALAALLVGGLVLWRRRDEHRANARDADVGGQT